MFHKICQKYSEIQLIKNKSDLNNPKMKNHPPSPGVCEKTVAMNVNNKNL